MTYRWNRHLFLNILVAHYNVTCLKPF